MNEAIRNDFINYLTSWDNFSLEDINAILSIAKLEKVRRHGILLREGDIARQKIFVVSGLLRLYNVNDDGVEHIMRFGPEKTWVIDHASYHQGIPTRFNIEAIEDSQVLTWSKDAFEQTMKEVPALRNFSEQMKARTMDLTQQRILANISYTPEEKYRDFIENYPGIIQRVPLHMVASFLGISVKTLGRVRSQRAVQRTPNVS